MGEIKDRIEMELKPYESICEKATEHLKCLICGDECIDPQEIMTVAKTVGEIVDIKKDIVEMYYKQNIIDAMEEDEAPERYGYNNRRYANGRYASKGRGMMGYKPYMEEDAYEYNYMMDPEFERNMRMGYRGRMGHEEPGMNGMSIRDDRYGRSYNKYREEKRHYTETKDMNTKNKMIESANDHLRDSMATMKEIWQDTDDNEFKMKMRNDLQRMLQEMVV